MDDLESLELLSLVTKVTSELHNHLGLADKTLAEFIIDQHVTTSSSTEFRKGLEAFGAEFPESLVESIDRLVKSMHPKYRSTKSQNGHSNGASAEKHKVFRGLAILDKDFSDAGEDEADALDDTFAALEGLAGKATATRKRSASPDASRGRDGHLKRHKDDPYSRSRSRGPRREKRRHRNGDENGSGRDKYVFEEDEYRSRKDGGRNGHKESRRRRRRSSSGENRLRRAPVPEIDDAPVLYKVYDGRVTGIKDYGAFANLQGVKGKVDGLVHVSQFQDGRVNHPFDLVSAGQEVKVKVIKTEGGKISLSMYICGSCIFSPSRSCSTFE